MNEDSAETDMAATYYLLRKRYGEDSSTRAAIEAAQGQWLKLRDTSCNIGSDGVSCRAKMTHARAQALSDLYSRASVN